MAKLRGARIIGAGSVDISSWSVRAAERFGGIANEHFEKSVLQAANEVLEHAVGYDVYASFNGVDDEAENVPAALEIDIALPLGPDTTDGPTWRFSMDELADGLVIMADTYRPGCLRFVRDKLLDLAKQIDAAIPED